MDSHQLVMAKTILFTVLASALSVSGTEENKLILTNDCPCDGHNLLFECTVIGGGSTVWRGSPSLFDCTDNEIILSHLRYASNVTGVCSSDEIVARSLRVDGNRYTSQLSIAFRESYVGTNVICIHDDGSTTASTASATITKNSIVSFPRPSNVRLTDADPQQLTFTWHPVAPHCTAINYNIISANCGRCPITTDHNTVTCPDMSVGENTTCSFVVENVRTCDNVRGNRSIPVEVHLKVPPAPAVVVIPRYSYSRNVFIGLTTTFDKVESFEISNGYDGSPLSYEVTYVNSLTGGSCGSDVIPASACEEEGVCSTTFKTSTATCSPLPHAINVSVSTYNVLGKGPMSNPITISTEMNRVADIKVVQISQRIFCTFPDNGLNMVERNCSVLYGVTGDSCRSSSQTSKSLSRTVVVGLPLSEDEKLEYCFIATADNGTHSVIIEGSFISDPNTTCGGSSNSCGVSLGVSITIFILLNVATVISFTVVVVILFSSRKKIMVELQQAKVREGHAIYEDLDYMYVDRPKGIDTQDNVSYSIKFANSELSVHYDDTK